MINLLFFYYTNNGLENSYMPNRYGDYLYLFLLVVIGNLVILIPFYWNNYIIYREAIVMSLVYIFCKKYPNQEYMVFFVLKVKATYFIWVYFAMTCL